MQFKPFTSVIFCLLGSYAALRARAVVQAATHRGDGSVINLGSFLGSTSNAAFNTNNAGQAVGQSIVGGLSIGISWSGGRAVPGQLLRYTKSFAAAANLAWRDAVIVGAGVLFFVILFTTSSSSQPSNPTATSYTYGNPELVTLEGYSGSQQDPNMSPDGQYLFFDSHNDAGQPMYLYYAKRIDYKTFQFIGKVPGVQYQGVDEGVEGMEDAAHNFYYVSPVFFRQGGGITIGHGIFSGSSVTAIAPVRGISPKPAPSGSRAINFDIFITPDGNILYFSDFMLDTSKPGASGVQGAQLSMAVKHADGSFTRAPNSDEILENVNATGKLVYNATPSPDGLAFAFNAAPYYGPHPKIYIATRSSTSDPFGKPELVTAADEVQGQISEPGSFSPDGTYFYFHRVLSDSASQLYVLTRQ